MKVGFVGLGVMGFPMAGYLAKAGHAPAVFNRSPEKAIRFVEAHGGTACRSVAEAAHRCDLLFMCVGDDRDVRGVVTEALDHMAPGAVIVDHTTASAKLARELSERAHAAGRAFLDAPVSGGQAGAEQGALTIMCGGDPSAYARAEPLMATYARSMRLMGPSGAGQLTKMVNQICIAGLVQGLAEAHHFAATAGLDLGDVYEAVSKGAAQSWQMDNRWATMSQGKFDYGFAVEWMRKDLGLVLDEARANGASLPVTAVVDQFYADVEAAGGARWDTSSLVTRLKR